MDLSRRGAETYSATPYPSSRYSHRDRQVVQRPIETYRDNPTTRPYHHGLQSCALGAVKERFTDLKLSPSQNQLHALNDVLKTLQAMAEATCPPSVYLTSLDPGVGKTITMVEFIKQITLSPEHEKVGVIVFLSRLDEVSRLVEEAGLDQAVFAVWTANEEINRLSSTSRDKAQVLFTTQQMLMTRCSGQSFQDCVDFHYLGFQRRVRIWDETLEPGEVVTLSSDELGGLPEQLRYVSSSLADDLVGLQSNVLGWEVGSVHTIPELDKVALSRAISSPSPSLNAAAKQRLEKLSALSGRQVRIIGGVGIQRIALYIRDALPPDIAPLLVLDASGRVRQTYSHWEKEKKGLVRLRSASKNYDALVIHVLDQGGGKDSWQKKGDQLAAEVATLIDSKPNEPWLVIHHKDARGVDPKAAILRKVQTQPDRVQFLHWGAHRATNAYKEIPNVILSGTLFLPEHQYLGLAYASTGFPIEKELPPALIKEIQLGELGHEILQGLCRASVRGGRGAKCAPCNAYIIAAKKTGIREELSSWFPGCKVKTWRPRHKALKGKIEDAAVYLKLRVTRDPTTPVLFSELMEILKIPNKANFNKTIRKHPGFQGAVGGLGLEEVVIGTGRYKNAFKRVWDVDPEATCVLADV